VDGVDEHLSLERDRLSSLLSGLKLELEEAKAEMEALWDSEHSAEYELTSVFIHRGSSALWGHYFFFTRHLPDAPDSWFKMNDSDVSVVSKEEVLADPGHSTANAYLVRPSVMDMSPHY
jgi:ubiquitin carboxyl-terminal hydrolase 25